MIPVRLAIQGFLSYRDRVEIDFTQLHIACITGENGAGKSSLLDAITWALFGKARKNDDSLINSAVINTQNSANPARAEVQFDFDYENARYRILRRLPAGKAMTVDLFLYDKTNDDYHVLTEKTRRKTDERIQSLLHLEYETFINASFFLQGKADLFTNQRPTERKRILSDILNLGIWETYKEKTAERLRTLKIQIGSLDDQLRRIDRELETVEPNRARLAEREAQLAAESEKSELALQRFQNARDAEAICNERAAALAADERDLNHRFSEIHAETDLLNDRRAEHAQFSALLRDKDEIYALVQELKQARAVIREQSELAERNFTLSKRIQTLTHAVQLKKTTLENEHVALLQRQDEIKRLRADRAREEPLRVELSERLADVESRIAVKSDLEKSIEALTDQLTTVVAESKLILTKNDEKRAHLKEVQEANGGDCPFCGREMDEDHCAKYVAELNAELESAEEIVAENRRTYEKVNGEKKALQRELETVRAAESERNKIQTRLLPLLTKQEDTLARIQRWETQDAPRFTEVERMLSAEEYALDERDELARITAERDALGYNPAQYQDAVAREAQTRPVEARFTALERAISSIAQLERELEERSAALNRKRLDADRRSSDLAEAKVKLAQSRAALPDVKRLRNEYEESQTVLNRLHCEIGAAKRELERLGDLASRKEVLRHEEKETKRVFALTERLNKAFSPNGIPALLIDEALPEIQDNANRILGKLTDDRLSVTFRSQREYKDTSRTDLRETLDILINDETGTRDYELFSGGEAFRVNFAIRLALSNILTRRAGARLQLLVIDEGFGSQDTDGRMRLIEAIHSIQDDYEKIFVITHLEELKDAFQSRIEITKDDNGSTVKVFP